MRQLDIQYLCDHAPESIIKATMNYCFYKTDEEDASLKEIILFIDTLCNKEGLSTSHPTLSKYQQIMKTLCIERKETDFKEKEEIEDLFLSDAEKIGSPLSANAARLLFKNLFALTEEGYQEEYIVPEFLIQFHISMLWDKGMMKEGTMEAVFDVYNYYY